MSKLSIENALNVLGIASIPIHPEAIDAAYKSALGFYQSSLKSPAAEPLHQLLKAAVLSLQTASSKTQNDRGSDPGYAGRLDAALSWISKSPLHFEILGAWLWVNGPMGATAFFAADLRASGLAWASKKACWYLCPKALASHPEAKRESWDLKRIRSTYAHRMAQGAQS